MHQARLSEDTLIHGMVGWGVFGMISTLFMSEQTEDACTVNLGNIRLAKGPKMGDLVNIWRCGHDGISKLDHF